MLKKVFSILLALTMVLSLNVVGSFAASKRNLEKEEAVAVKLKSLNLFKGVSDTNFDLGRAPSRVEALVIMERLLGKETEILAGSYSHPFDDVPNWADNYIGYAYENGLTKGVSATKYGTGNASSAMFLTFVLRAMGYSDSDGDFTWDNPNKLAMALGLLDDSIVVDSGFLRADCGSISYNALSAKLKDGKTTLAEKLIGEGVFTKEAYEASKRVTDGSRIYLPETIQGVSSKDLARTCGCDEDLYYIVNPKTEADHINNIKYVMLTGQWTYKKMGGDLKPVLSWGNCARTVSGQNKTLSNMQGQLFGVFANHWNEFYYENGGYSLYCYFDPVMSPADIQTHLVEALKAIEAKHNELYSSGKLSKNSSDYEIAKAYSTWMVDYTKTTKARSAGFPEATLTQTAYGHLGLGVSNCVGRAAAIAMAWSYEGLTAYTVLTGMGQAGCYDDHVLPWTVIDGKEYVCESQSTLGLYEVEAGDTVPSIHQFISPYAVAFARKAMGLSFDAKYDLTDPNFLSKAEKLTACVNGIPCTVDYVKTDKSGNEIYFVKVDASYTETAKQKYYVTLSTADGRGQRSVYNSDLDTLKKGVTITIPGYRILETLFYGMDTICVRVAD